VSGSAGFGVTVITAAVATVGGGWWRERSPGRASDKPVILPQKPLEISWCNIELPLLATYMTYANPSAEQSKLTLYSPGAQPPRRPRPGLACDHDAAIC